MRQCIAILAVLAVAESFVPAAVPAAAASKSVTSRRERVVVNVGVAEISQTDTLDTKPSTNLANRFGDLKGQDVKTVSESMGQFCKGYPKPILPQYRTIINDLIQSTHLTIVDARFKYDPMFAFGLHGMYYKLMRAYPGAGEADKIFAALAGALGLDSEKVAADSKAVADWSQSASEADLLSQLKGEGSGVVADIAKAAKADEYYMYSKLWGLGLIQVMEAIGVEATEEKMEELVTAIGFQAGKARQDLVQYRDIIDRSAQAEQLFKEIEIREKKKMAERLEAKAQRAIEAAQKAEAGEE